MVVVPPDPVLLNIGNTHTQIRYPGDSAVRTLLTTDLDDSVFPAGVSCAAACVVPDCLPLLKQKQAFLLTAETASCMMDFSQVDASTIGADRLANAAALIEQGCLPAISIDAGTAVTMEIVDAAKSFCGGMIAPGRTMMRRALHTGTGLLPEVPLQLNLPPFPATNTVDAIRAGTNTVLVEGIRYLCRQVEEKFRGKKVRFIICGGDAPFFLKHLDFAERGAEDFTLSGVLAVYRRYHSCV